MLDTINATVKKIGTAVSRQRNRKIAMHKTINTAIEVDIGTSS